ncbi:IS91 family transposase [Fusibacter ferrireducens]
MQNNYLLSLVADKKHLGTQIGLTGILHTWGQTLSYHPHVHFIVPGGGLCLDTMKFKKTRRKYLIPVKIMSSTFKGIFINALKKLFKEHKLIGWHFDDDSEFQKIVDVVYSKDFVVNCKSNFDSPTHVINYLCQYTHRVAIANHRILKVTDQFVTFKYKDYRDDHKTKTMTLTGIEFIRRFLMHVLPSGFVKIRHYGILAGRNRHSKLAHCQRIMKIIPSKRSNAFSKIDFLSRFMNVDFYKCPKCPLEPSKLLSINAAMPSPDG